MPQRRRAPGSWAAPRDPRAHARCSRPSRRGRRTPLAVSGSRCGLHRFGLATPRSGLTRHRASTCQAVSACGSMRNERPNARRAAAGSPASSAINPARLRRNAAARGCTANQSAYASSSSRFSATRVEPVVGVRHAVASKEIPDPRHGRHRVLLGEPQPPLDVLDPAPSWLEAHRHRCDGPRSCPGSAPGRRARRRRRRPRACGGDPGRRRDIGRSTPRPVPARGRRRGARGGRRCTGRRRRGTRRSGPGPRPQPRLRARAGPPFSSDPDRPDPRIVGHRRRVGRRRRRRRRSSKSGGSGAAPSRSPPRAASGRERVASTTLNSGLPALPSDRQKLGGSARSGRPLRAKSHLLTCPDARIGRDHVVDGQSLAPRVLDRLPGGARRRDARPSQHAPARAAAPGGSVRTSARCAACARRSGALVALGPLVGLAFATDPGDLTVVAALGAVALAAVGALTERDGAPTGSPCSPPWSAASPPWSPVPGSAPPASRPSTWCSRSCSWCWSPRRSTVSATSTVWRVGIGAAFRGGVFGLAGLRRAGRPGHRGARARGRLLRVPRVQPAAGVAVHRAWRSPRDRLRALGRRARASISCPGPARSARDAAHHRSGVVLLDVAAVVGRPVAPAALAHRAPVRPPRAPPRRARAGPRARRSVLVAVQVLLVGDRAVHRAARCCRCGSGVAAAAARARGPRCRSRRAASSTA